MPGPTWDQDAGRWVLDDESAPAPRRGRRRAVEVIDRYDGDDGRPASPSPEDLVADVLVPRRRERPVRPVTVSDRRSRSVEDLLPPPGPATGRHGTGGPGADETGGTNGAGAAPRRGRRRAPEEPDDVPPRPYPGARTPAAPRPAGYEGVPRSGRRRAPEPVTDVVPAVPAGPHGAFGHPVDGRDAGFEPVPPRPYASRTGYGTPYAPDDGAPGAATTWAAVDVEAPAHDADLHPDTAPHLDDAPGPDDDAVEDRPIRGRRRAEPDATRRRRWPWVVGAAAAVAAAVPIGFAVLGGPDDDYGSSRSESTVAFGTSTGSGQPGVAPTADAPAADTAPGDAPAAEGAGGTGSASGQITFEVNGSGTARMITFGGGSSIGQVSGVPLPWQRAVAASGEPAEYSVTASGGDGEISCRILVDGAVISEESAGGGYSAVSCIGRH